MESAREKVIVVTGASRGIGAATARAAAAAGFAVCVNYVRHRSAADSVVAAIRDGGGSAVAVGADVAVDADVAALFETVDRELGRVTALVNNAGVVAPAARLDEMEPDRWSRMFAVNVFGAMACAREAVRRMSTLHGGRGGAIVNVSSAAARIGAPAQYVDYAASKAAIEALTVGLAKEVATEGIRVNAVRPGIVDTEIHVQSGNPDWAANAAAIIPLGRTGTAEEVAAAIVWLLSDAASYSTGAILDVTGGR